MQLIADNIHIMNPVVAQAVQTGHPGPITDLARQCTSMGADWIDVNPGPKTRKYPNNMTFCLQAVQAGTGLPLCLDSNDPDVLEQGLQRCSGGVIINGFSLEAAKVKHILPLAVSFQVPIVGFLLRPDGSVPKGLDERMHLASELIQAGHEAGLDLSQLIIDPALPPLGWDDGSAQARSVLDCIRLLPELAAGQVQTVVGLSNLTSGVSHSAAPHLEAIYLAMLAEAGLSYALLNITRNLSRLSAKFSTALDHAQVLTWAELETYLP